MLFLLLSASVAQPQSEAVELSPGGPHLRGLTAACIISPSVWILIGPDQRAGRGDGGRWWVTLQLETGFVSKMRMRNEREREVVVAAVWRWGMYGKDKKMYGKEDKKWDNCVMLCCDHL